MARGEEIIIEGRIRTIINQNIIGEKESFTLMDSKNVADIIVCRNTNIPKIFFIEVKHYSDTNGRIGFGDSNGTGFQPEILTKRSQYFEDNLVWIFQKENDDDYYYILNNNDCLKYVSGGTIGRKQNNFQPRLFDEIKPLSEKEFINWLKNWLSR
jgi:hypothetical protein